MEFLGYLIFFNFFIFFIFFWNISYNILENVCVSSDFFRLVFCIFLKIWVENPYQILGKGTDTAPPTMSWLLLCPYQIPGKGQTPLPPTKSWLRREPTRFPEWDRHRSFSVPIRFLKGTDLTTYQILGIFSVPIWKRYNAPHRNHKVLFLTKKGTQVMTLYWDIESILFVTLSLIWHRAITLSLIRYSCVSPLRGDHCPLPNIPASRRFAAIILSLSYLAASRRKSYCPYVPMSLSLPPPLPP